MNILLLLLVFAYVLLRIYKDNRISICKVYKLGYDIGWDNGFMAGSDYEKGYEDGFDDGFDRADGGGER